MSKLIEGHSEERLLAAAKGIVEKKTLEYTVLDAEAEDRIPKFQLSELQLGKVLGRGGFCVVHEIVRIKLQESVNEKKNVEHFDDEGQIHNIVQDRHFMEKYCIRGGKDYRYAIKILQDSSKNDVTTFVNGVVDLAVEARFLAVIRHPNIIKMRAMSAGTPYDSKFFVVLDRLYDIMPVRLSKWKKMQPRGMRKMMDRGGKKEKAFWVERLVVAFDMTCALKYLHDMRIVYRDIKPDNIGFDVRGDVKIFDFGLAREFHPNNKDKDGLYQMTGDTGSPRYMAPEVALNQPYDERVDVYSFCILLWEMLMLETPFDGYTMNLFRKKVVEGKARPACDAKWPSHLTSMMRRGWGDILSRPSMEEVSSCLLREINANSEESYMGQLDVSGKSLRSMHKGSQASSGDKSR